MCTLARAASPVVRRRGLTRRLTAPRRGGENRVHGPCAGSSTRDRARAGGSIHISPSQTRMFMKS